MTATATREKVQSQPPPQSPRFRLSTWWLVAATIAVWVVVWSFTKGEDTLVIGGQESTDIHDWFYDLANSIQNADNWFTSMTHGIADGLSWFIETCQGLFAEPNFPRPVPEIGWLGVLAIATWLTLAAAGWRMAILTGLSFLSFGLLGFWEDSINLLIITLTSVGIAVVIGIPLAVWMGNSKKATAVITPILDLFQTFPALTYLLPLFLLFGLGAATAAITTLIYALPPVIRIAAHGIRTVSTTTIEATTSMGQTRLQRIMKVQLPMAKRTVIVGINQTTMAALSMATIAALINGPGLGQPVIAALQVVQVGQAFVPGLAIVIMAIMLDRVTTAISMRSERLKRAGGGNRKLRLIVLGITGVVTLVCIYLSRTYSRFAEFPEDVSIGDTIATQVQDATDWISSNLDGLTNGFRDLVTSLMLNPLQDLLAESPWWLAFAAMVTISGFVGGRWAALTALVCLTGIYFLDLWNYSMITLTMTLVATVMVMALALVFGVWMGRSKVTDNVLRPLLDAGQTMPPFVYLIPVLALFGPTRFTAIVAAIIYAAPVAIKIVADGIRGVSPTTIEAATAAGSSTWQIISKVQLPMARGALMLATNQGLLYVLSMAVIGGMVGAGALGFDIVSGFRQGEDVGRGLAASLSVVLIGIMLDRVTRRAAMRSGAAPAH